MSLIRLHITTEGQTEEGFVKRVLAPYLAERNIFASYRSVLTSKDNKADRQYRGGMLDYQRAQADILTWMKEDHHPECRFTTMFDLYALPEDFPEYDQARRIPEPYVKVEILERALAEDIQDSRFFPYLQLHEFEALILADPQKLDYEYLEHERPIANLMKMVVKCGDNPELINDGPTTAPSKRIRKEIPEYDKVTAGPLVTEKIGITVLRKRCRHFDQWLSSIECLVT